MELIRIFDKNLSETGVLGVVEELEYTRAFREAGSLSLVASSDSVAAAGLAPDGFVVLPEGEMYIITSVENDLRENRVRVKGEGVLSLFGRVAFPEEYSLDGEVSALLLSLARKGAGVIPGSFSLGGTVEGKTVHFDSGRSYLYGDMVSLCHAGDVGMSLTWDGAAFLFSPLLPRSRGEGSEDPVILSGRLGTLEAERYVRDFGPYKNAAVVSGALNGRGGRYTTTVYRDEVDISDSFPDGDYGERQMLVNFSVPTSSYTVETAAGVEQFDYASYLAAMRAAGAAALGRQRPRIRLVGEVVGEIDPGDRVTLRDSVHGMNGDAVAELVRVSYKDGRRVVTAEVSAG